MEIHKRKDETDFQFHKRIIFGKLIDKTLSDIDYAELSEPAYGQRYSSDVARRMFYGSKRTLEILENNAAVVATTNPQLSEVNDSIIELRKERQKCRDQRTAYNKVLRDRVREEEFLEILKESIGKSTVPSLTPFLSNAYMDIKPSDNDLLVSLNDIHYGIIADNAWTKYNPEICRQMMQRYLERIIEIARTHGSENCIVFNNGDSISGKIHLTIQIANRENVVEQVKGVSELIAEFLAALSPYFKSISYVSVAGNHSRLDTKENSPLDERLDDLIEWYLSARLQDFENIRFSDYEKLDPTMYMVSIRGKNYVGVHGDYDGSDSKISALQTMVGKPVYAVLLGHKHHNMVDEVQGIKTIMAGSFVGMDDYCIQKRIYGKPEQMVCVCNDSGVLCHYDIPLI